MAKSRKEIGRRGEELASEYLIRHGHKVLERNWQGGHLEIDLITAAEDGVHFVEVKSLSAGSEADPTEKVNPLKQKRITDAALRFLNGFGEDREVFFDVVTVVFEGEEAKLEYYPRAWIPIYI